MTEPTSDVVDDLLSQPLIAVAGVSERRDKYGWIVYASLRGRGYRVVPVNPRYDEIAGEKCYRSILEAPEEVGLVVTVVPPAATRQVVQEALQRGIRRFWMQPGSEDAEAISEAEAAGATVVAGPCIMCYESSAPPRH